MWLKSLNINENATFVLSPLNFVSKYAQFNETSYCESLASTRSLYHFHTKNRMKRMIFSGKFDPLMIMKASMKIMYLLALEQWCKRQRIRSETPTTDIESRLTHRQ